MEIFTLIIQHLIFLRQRHFRSGGSRPVADFTKR